MTSLRLASLTALAAGSAALAQQYAVTEFSGAPPDFYVSSLAENGVVSGGTAPAVGPGRAYTWFNGTATPYDGYPGRVTVANASNVSATVIGMAGLPTGVRHAAVWQGSSFTDLGSLAGPDHYSQAIQINEAGWIVGGTDVQTSGGNFHSRPFLYRNGVMENLGGPIFGLYDGSAESINSEGEVVGNFADFETQTFAAFTWREGVGIQALSDHWMFATHINDLGVVVGRVDRSAGFVWQNGSYITLGRMASSVNNLGVIVGSGDNGHATIWRNLLPTQLDTVLNETGWNLDQASAINDAGQIIAHAVQRPPGSLGPFILLNPIPEPASLITICFITFSTMAARTLRRRD